jgi:hypothetical protein
MLTTDHSVPGLRMSEFPLLVPDISSWRGQRQGYLLFIPLPHWHRTPSPPFTCSTFSLPEFNGIECVGTVITVLRHPVLYLVDKRLHALPLCVTVG